jgi:hypothetical protein
MRSSGTPPRAAFGWLDASDGDDAEHQPDNQQSYDWTNNLPFVHEARSSLTNKARTGQHAGSK